ncbi:MAG TPA: (Fe-S)-binding protein [Dehalococcoidia bacterium]|nr:(Fe-S)-binding protein [Dehalococcoidia bacterium]
MAQRPGTPASLFVTCIIDQLYPEVGVSVVRVLRKLGVKVAFPQDQTCCGQPLYNSGFTGQARQLARRVIKSLGSSQYVVVPSGSCAAMMRVFYLDLFEDDPSLQQARRLASRVYEFSEFLVNVLGVDDVGAAYSGTATYHPSCHLLRELEVREAPGKLLVKVTGLGLVELPRQESCCGFGGAFSVKYPHISEEMAADKVNNVTSTRADTLVSCDMGCLMNIGGALSRQGHHIKIRHLAQVLDQERP